jgi:CD109 antigen
LEIKFSTYKAKPGATCTMKMKTKANSFVSLLGIDQSITLLGAGNDIDKARVAADFNTYNAHKNHPELKIKGNHENRYVDFGESNAFILTNALDGKKECGIDERTGSDNQGQGVLKDDEDDNGVISDDDNDDENSSHPDKPKARKNFPETWIFEDFEADDDGKYTLEAKVPDSITSFIVTGFAIHPDYGLGIAMQQKLTVFQEFFIKLYLPYSVRFGEILKVDVTVFNYISRPKRAVNADVKIFNKENEFEFIDTAVVGGECKITPSEHQHRTKSISVPAGNGASTFFLIRALVTGQIKIKVRASTSNQGDEVERMMLVEHEGMTKTENKPMLIDLRGKNHEAHSFDLSFATEKVVWNSIVIEASVIGDLLGPAFANIHNLM